MTMHRAGDHNPDNGDDNDNDEGQDLKGGPSRGEKGKGWPGPDPETGDEEEAVVDVMAKAITQERLGTTKRPADPPWVFKNKSYQDIRIWLMVVQDYFEQNSHLWTTKVDRIKSALGRMEGDDVAPFNDTYRKKMSEALGYKKEIGYEIWYKFEQRVTGGFTPTHKVERTHKLMKLEKYNGDIRQFLLWMENHNMKVGLQGVVWRDMIQAQMPEAGLLRLSFETYPNDELWLEGFKNVIIQYKDYKEEKRLRHAKGESSGTLISWKTEDRAPTMSNTRLPKRYTKEKRAAIWESLRHLRKRGGPKRRQLPHRRR